MYANNDMQFNVGFLTKKFLLVLIPVKQYKLCKCNNLFWSNNMSFVNVTIFFVIIYKYIKCNKIDIIINIRQNHISKTNIK